MDIDYVKYQTYTKESMYAYLDSLFFLYFDWKREEGVIEGSDLPWVSFENPERNWMHYWTLEEEGHLTKSQFNPNTIVSLRASNETNT